MGFELRLLEPAPTVRWPRRSLGGRKIRAIGSFNLFHPSSIPAMLRWDFGTTQAAQVDDSQQASRSRAQAAHNVTSWFRKSVSPGRQQRPCQRSVDASPASLQSCPQYARRLLTLLALLKKAQKRT